MSRIAILYIALGRYDNFWEDFYLSCERYFLSDLHKEYFVFTDSEKIQANARIHRVPVKDNGWPRNTLDRFFFFDKISDELSGFDYCFFFNANTLFLKKVTPVEVLPGGEHEYLVNLSWHLNDGMKPSEFPYERNPHSTACIPMGEGTCYFQGGLIGGRSREFLEMKDSMIRKIMQDNDSGIVASCHDESHLNRYLVDRHPLCLPTCYGRPQEWDAPADPAIVFRTKENVLGSYYIFKLKKKPLKYVYRQFVSRIKQLIGYK
jgi:hypothetical protein